MTDTTRINNAIIFATRKHAGQFRKGTDLPYVKHPFDVGMFLQRIDASDDVIIAGLLHDTLEDTNTTREEIVEAFGAHVADIVQQVTCTDKSEVLHRARRYTHDATLVKAADLISNTTDMYRDYQEEGDTLFERFSNSKEYTLEHYKKLAEILRDQCCLRELSDVLTKLEKMS